MTPKFVQGAILLSSLLLGLGGCDRTPPETASSSVVPPAAIRSVIACMGDSLTAGYRVDEAEAYPALLEARLVEAGFNYQVINAGVSGETSSGALARLDWMLTLEPDIVILETGANDGLRGIDPALTRRNIEAIVARLKAEDIIIVLAGMKMVRNLGAPFTRSFNAIYSEVAQAYDLIRIPFILEDVAGRAQFNQPDGIHPTAEGYRIVSANLYPYVLEAIKRHQER